MGWIIYFIAIITYLLFPIVLCDCGSEIQSPTDFYPVDSFIYNGSISECGCDNENICIRKCCASNYILKNETCVFNNSNYLKNLQVYKNAKLMKKETFKVRFVPGMVYCNGKANFVQLYPDLFPEYDGNIQSDGKLYLRKLNIFFGQDDFCVDYTEEFGIIYDVCQDLPVSSFTVEQRINVIGIMISLPFFLITFVVYALLPERNLHAMCLMSHVFAIFVAYVLAIAMYFVREWNMDVCRGIMMTIMCCFMSSIFWVNLMAFDICSAFSGSRRQSPNKKQDERKRFIIYNIYAWGIPLIFIALIVILSNTVQPNAWYDPGVRGVQCAIVDGLPMLIYYFGPLAILILSNIVMFIITACKIRKAKKDTAMLMNTGCKKHGAKDSDKQMFQLYIRLLFAMGLNWSMEIISWAVDWQVKGIPPAVWYVTDFCNAAYGIIVFILFVCKKNIWKALKSRYYKVIGKHQANITNTQSSSS